MNKKNKVIFFIALGSLFLMANFALADPLENPIQMNSLSDLINAIADWLFKIGLVLVPLLFVIGGIKFIAAQGNATQVQDAKKLMVYTAIGLLVILLAKSLVEVLEGFIK